MTFLSPRQRTLLRDALAIALLGIALGLTVNSKLVLSALEVPAPPTAPVAVSPGVLSMPTPIDLAELRSLPGAEIILIDARSTLIYADGHLPAAISLPLEEVSDGARPLPELPKKTIVVYCGGYGCEDSFSLAMLLCQAGFKNLRVFEGGYPQWVDAGLPIVKGAP